jgi:glycosyltransferase involved in cell wall biosynthesis
LIPSSIESLRVLIVGSEPSLPSGISNFVVALSTFLSHEADITPLSFNETEIKGYTSSDNPGKIQMIRGSLRMLRAYKSAIRTCSPNIIHINSAYGRSFFEKALMARTARRLNVPAVVHLHGSRLDKELPRMLAPVRHRVAAVLSPPIETIVLSDLMEHILGESLPSVRTTVIPTCVPLIKSPPRLFAAPVRVGFLGMLIGRKGEADLIRAISRSRDRSYEVLIAGDGPLRHDAEALVAREGLQGRVRFLGTISGADKDRFFHDIDLLCLPSHAENLPTALIEAMNYGRPVITTPVGGVSELVQEGSQGWLVPPGDIARLAEALDEAVSDPNELRRRGCIGRKTVEARYSWEINGPRYVELYRRMVSSSLRHEAAFTR